MAATSGKKTSSSGQKKKNTTNSKKSSQYKKNAVDYRKESEMFHEIGLIIFFIAMVLLFLCNFGIIGTAGNAIRDIMFGIFGLSAYIAPIVLFLTVCFWYANSGNPHAIRRLMAALFLFLMLGIVFDLIAQNASNMTQYNLKNLYEYGKIERKGGGIFAGSLHYVLNKYFGFIGTILVVLLCASVSFILLTEKSLLSGMKDGGSRVLEKTREDKQRRMEYAQERRALQEEQRIKREEDRIKRDEERRIRQEEKENERIRQSQAKEDEKILRVDKKVTGVTMDVTIPKKENGNLRRNDIHEIMYNEEQAPEFDFDKIRVKTSNQVTMTETLNESAEEMPAPVRERRPKQNMEEIRIHTEHTSNKSSAEPVRPVAKSAATTEHSGNLAENKPIREPEVPEKKLPKKYIFPPLSRLQKGTGSGSDNTRELKETALRLQQTLNTFGVKVTVTDISQGPSVTRYELQPEQGVKVSKIVSLTDDIKLNLAATDIRIEAPIPGKAAIGIEVPNKETIGVALRDLFESKEFRDFPSNIAFAVGKDIAGQTIVTDIAKMPHMLIAGATGSGKSVCINTLIMSILYKAHPDDVKLIMVDPKVVELSVYNGIPHLLIPVVTDPKKASAALHWAVNEMNERYRLFADLNVRDIKGYNKIVESQRESGDESAPAKLPQIVIIVDELADLMMVAPGEVEESICRLAQLARACGIHLIIATQRPSVDVITGLIKANMPSRIAFSVSSGVDSRTILDMNGAEKLLGKGDMLFYPQGYSKPARVQGAFVSDKEVSDVVDFLKNQALGNTYAEDIEEKLKNISSGSNSSSGADGSSGSGNGLDEYFADAGKFIIEKDKASIGMLQRMFRIGFNRAARIMDQLCEYGVVGEEEGTKPRKVLMSMEQFEQLLEEVI